MIWREKRTLLSTLGGLLLLNLIFFVTYRVRYEQRVQELDMRLDQTRAELADAKKERLVAQARLNGYRKLVQDIETIYEDWWSTPDERLTALIVELQRLEAASNLVPKTKNYDIQEMKKEQTADAMHITFSVQGPYQRIRQLINLIELSKQFVAIDSISITGAGTDSSILNLNLQLKTLFRGKSKDSVRVSGT